MARSLEERIQRGHEAIATAKSQGRDVSEWEKHLLRLRIEHISQSVFSQMNIGIEIYSEVLGCNVWLCSNEAIAEQVKSDNPVAVTYTAEELIELIKANPTPEALKEIHEAKSVFKDSRIVESK